MKRKLEVRLLPEDDLSQATPVPVKAIKVEVEPGRRILFFTVRGEDRDVMKSAESLTNLAQVLGDLAHPAQCVMMVAPENCRVEVYEIVDEKGTDGETN